IGGLAFDEQGRSPRNPTADGAAGKRSLLGVGEGADHAACHLRTSALRRHRCAQNCAFAMRKSASNREPLPSRLSSAPDGTRWEEPMGTTTETLRKGLTTIHDVRGGGGLRLHVRDWGRPGGPPILSIHGWSQGHLCWARQY